MEIVRVSLKAFLWKEIIFAQVIKSWVIVYWLYQWLRRLKALLYLLLLAERCIVAYLNKFLTLSFISASELVITVLCFDLVEFNIEKAIGKSGWTLWSKWFASKPNKNPIKCFSSKKQATRKLKIEWQENNFEYTDFPI